MISLIKGLKIKSPKEILFNYGFYILFVILVITYGVSSNLFLSFDNIILVLNSTVFILVVATGVTVVMITGDFDLSFGSVALLSAAVMALAVQADWPVGLAIVVGLLVGIVAGLVHGLLVAFLNMSSMLTTLGLLIAYRGVALLITKGAALMLPRVFKDIALIKFSGITMLFVISVAIMIILQIVLKKTRFGVQCYAVGCNEKSAKKIGISVKKIKIIVFIISGLCASITGLFLLSIFGLYQDSIGRGIEFTVVASIVIGGTSLLGGRGNILPGTFFGVLLLYVIDNGLALLNASPFIYPFVQGIVIFAAMYMDSLRTYRKIN